ARHRSGQPDGWNSIDFFAAVVPGCEARNQEKSASTTVTTLTNVFGASLAAVRISTNWRRAPFPTSDTSLLPRFRRIHRSRQCCHPEIVAGFRGLLFRLWRDLRHKSALFTGLCSVEYCTFVS